MSLAGTRGPIMEPPRRVPKPGPPGRGAGSRSLLYDYSSPQAYPQSYVQPTAAVAPAHILEVCKLPDGIKPYEADTLLMDVKRYGATIKWLDSCTVIAIFKTAAAAKEALQKINNPMFQLKAWTASVNPTAQNSTFGPTTKDPNNEQTDDPWND
jgi:hypothetical protein